MIYLLKKMFRDLWKLKAQFIAVFLMSLLGVLIYTGIEGVWYGRLNYAEKLFNETNLADAWVTGKDLDTKDINKIKNMKEIENVQASALYNVKMNISGGKQEVLLIASNKNEISLPIVTKGEEYKEYKEGCWIYEDYAKEHNIKLNDIVEFENDGKTLSLEVKGLVLSPEYLSYTGSKVTAKPDHFKYGYGFVSKDTLQKLYDNEIYFQQLKLKIKNYNNLEKKLEDNLKEKYVSYSDRTNFVGVSSYIDKFTQVRKMSVLFSAVFIILAILTIQTTMKRMIETQRIQIGTLKAIGYKSRDIKIHYMMYGFFISLFGGIIGYFLAPITVAKILINAQKSFYSVANWDVEISFISIAVVILITLICTFTALYSSYKDCSEMPANTMRAKPPRNKKSFLLKVLSGFLGKVSNEWRWTIRESILNRTRTVIGIIGVAGSIMLLMASFGVRESLINTNRVLYGEQINYGTKITLKPNITDDEREEIFDKTNKDGQWVQENNIEIRTSTSKKNSLLSILDEGYFYHLKDEMNNNLNMSNSGVIISSRLADELNIKENDTIQFKISGENEFKTVIVKAVSNIISPQGIYISKKAWNNIGGKFLGNILLIKDKEISKNVKDLEYINETTTLDKQLSEVEDIISSTLIIIIMLICSAVLLSVIILNNLGLLSFTERAREYATLKVIGYYKKEIKSVIKRDIFIQLIIGIIIGIPLGYRFLEFYVGAISTNDFEYIPYISFISLIFSVLIVVICSYIVISIISRKVKNINMIEALKSVE